MCSHILENSQFKHLVEVHNRPYLFKYISKKLSKIPITIFFHNDPTTMKGSKSYDERKYLQKNASKIYCVSDFIKSKFLDGFDENVDNVHVLYNGIERLIEHFPKKNKDILFVGRLVKEKGVHLFVDAVNDIAKKFADWNFLILGSSHLGSIEKSNKFSLNVSKKFESIGEQTKFTGFLSHDEVQQRMQTASVIVVPSIWDEPYGLVVAEAMANGAAVIASNLGGIPEILGNNGILLDEINKDSVKNSIISLIKNKNKLAKYQNLSWHGFSHKASISSKKLDNFRIGIANKFFK
jgi:glycosyltransferase involved in cell wall biosynthesis